MSSLSIEREKNQPGMVTDAYNPSTGRLKQEDQEFEASLGYIGSSRPACYIMTPCLKKSKQSKLKKKGVGGDTDQSF